VFGVHILGRDALERVVIYAGEAFWREQLNSGEWLPGEPGEEHFRENVVLCSHARNLEGSKPEGFIVKAGKKHNDC
jgi:hypothetical protein